MTEAKLPPPDESEGSDKEKQPSERSEDAAPEMPVTEGRSRKALADEVELSPGSLVGSYCHRVENGRITYAGQVVGEIQPGKYLVQIDLFEGVKDVQVVYPLEEMLAKDVGYEWRFYDTREAMQEAYVQYAVEEMTDVGKGAE